MCHLTVSCKTCKVADVVLIGWLDRVLYRCRGDGNSNLLALAEGKKESRLVVAGFKERLMDDKYC